MSAPEVNIPLLRKAIEWAEAEAAKPEALCEWAQTMWITPRGDEQFDVSVEVSTLTTTQRGRSPECGTCFCIAGFVQFQADGIVDENVAERAAELLGLPASGAQAHPLFAGYNTIDDVRRIAEDIAGERL